METARTVADAGDKAKGKGKSMDYRIAGSLFVSREAFECFFPIFSRRPIRLVVITNAYPALALGIYRGRKNARCEKLRRRIYATKT